MHYLLSENGCLRRDEWYRKSQNFQEAFRQVTGKFFRFVSERTKTNSLNAPSDAELGGWLMQGKIKYRVDVVEGLEQTPKAINKLFDGSNQGKLVVKI